MTLTDDTSLSANCEMAILNENEYSEYMSLDDLDWQAFDDTVDWQLSEGDGAKTVYIL